MTSPHASAADDNWIASTVNSLGFPRPDMQYLAWLRQGLVARIPINFQPTNKYHRDSVRVLKTEGMRQA